MFDCEFSSDAVKNNVEMREMAGRVLRARKREVASSTVEKARKGMASHREAYYLLVIQAFSE
jgi:hypothetical protein